MTEINNRRLALFEGRCWHDWIPEYYWDGSDVICKKCGCHAFDSNGFETNPNPSYSTSADDRERLLEYLMGQEEMWGEFTFWAYVRVCPLPNKDAYYRWISLPLDGVPRWVSLLSEWLRLDEVREKFGRKCELDCEVSCLSYKGACSGKIPAEWAKEE